MFASSNFAIVSLLSVKQVLDNSIFASKNKVIVSNFNKQGMVLLSDREYATTYDWNDLKITLKVFLEKFDITHVENAIDATISQLETDNIEQLIIAFPHQENENGGPDAQVDNEWLEEVLKIWKKFGKNRSEWKSYERQGSGF